MEEQSGRFFIFRIDLIAFIIKLSINSLEISSSLVAIVMPFIFGLCII